MNTLPPSPAWWAEVAADVATLPASSYPDATYLPLREAIAAYAGVAAEQVVPGAGADEIILLDAPSSRSAAATWRVVAKPTYQLYAVATRTAGARLEAVEPRAGPALAARPRRGAGRSAPAARLVWLCSPEQPDRRGGRRPRPSSALCAACPGVVLSTRPTSSSAARTSSGLVERHENLVVARTFSKGWGLGGIRCGYALASPAAGRGARRPAPARLDLVVAARARPSSPAATRGRRCAADAAAIRRAERDRLAARHRGARASR